MRRLQNPNRQGTVIVPIRRPIHLWGMLLGFAVCVSAYPTDVSPKRQAANTGIAFLTQPLPKEAPTPAEVDGAIDRALAFLGSLYSPEYLFDDPYIRCDPPLDATGCTTRYRKVDLATIVHFFLPEKLRRDARLSRPAAAAERILLQYKEQWKDQPIEGLPIDLYAIFPYYYPEEAAFMGQELLRAEREDGSWEDYDHYGANAAFRKVTDESWCIVSLAKLRVPWEPVKRALDRKQVEGQKIMSGEWQWGRYEKYYAMAHIFHSFLWTGWEGYDLSEYVGFVEEVKQWLAESVRGNSLMLWTTTQAETLYWLSEGRYHDRSTLARFAQDVLRRQKADGGWKTRESDKDEVGRSHTTLVAILALDSYKRNILKQKG